MLKRPVMIKNTSGIVPVGISILVLPDNVKTKTDSGIIMGTGEQLEREQLKQTDGVVVAIAENAYFDETPRCKVGDRVIMAAYAGMIRKGNDELTYRLIRDADVVAVLLEKE